MESTFILISDKTDIQEDVIISELKADGVLSVKRQEPQRGFVTGAIKALKLLVGFSGASDKIADGLIRIAEQRFAGSTLKVKVGATEVEVSNVRRKDLIDIFDKISLLSAAASNL